MTATDQQIKYCMSCAHFVTPQHSTAECHAPGADGMPSMRCRDTDGPCGPSAKLYQELRNGFKT